jgi:hypothetical protein
VLWLVVPYFVCEDLADANRSLTAGGAMATHATWKGTIEESQALAEAVGHNCACPAPEDDAVSVVCGPHRILLVDQRALDGLLFVRQIRAMLISEAFGDSAHLHQLGGSGSAWKTDRARR